MPSESSQYGAGYVGIPVGTTATTNPNNQTNKPKNNNNTPKPVDDSGWVYGGGGNNNNRNNNNNNRNGGKPKSYDAQIVPGAPDPKSPGQVNVVDYASELATNPKVGFTKDMKAQKQLSEMDPSSGLMPTQPGMDYNRNDITAPVVSNVEQPQTATYQATQTYDKVAQQDMQAAQGQLSEGSVINPDEVPQVDLQGLATGYNADGSINHTGQALQKYATQNISNIIDTSTAAGKLLAEQLGEGNYLDSKATLKGQLEILQSEFVDPNTGEPKIPAWAAATARNVSKIAAFKGMTGTAATAAMAQALLEASIPIAQADSQFFQTLTLQNLDNRQQSIINTANTLAKFEQTNVDNRMAAAIQNAKHFLEMDMANLSNEQQARVINYQGRVQSILEDAKADNVAKQFNAQSENDMNKFYDQLNSQINMYNASMNLDAQKFNATMADSREKFYREMGYNVDLANAKWRQEVTLVEDQQQFQAAAMDVKNMYDLSTSQLNQIWDRSDAILDYTWKTAEGDANRTTQLAMAQLAAEGQADAGMWGALGTLTGAFVGSDFFSKTLGGIFG